MKSGTWVRLILHEAGWQNRIFLRTPPAVFFTFFFPMAMMGMTIWRLPPVQEVGEVVRTAIPGLAGLAAVIGSYVNLAAGVALARERLILKRVYGSPMPVLAYLAGCMLSAGIIAVVAAWPPILTGMIAFGMRVELSNVFPLLIVLLAGAACFGALGVAVGSLAPSAQTAPPLAMFSLMLLSLPSGMVADLGVPDWLVAVTGLFPLRPFAEAIGQSLAVGAMNLAGWAANLGVLVAWTAVGLMVARRCFRWLPRPG
jgi:ABC-type multidrug transport system permease subunit